MPEVNHSPSGTGPRAVVIGGGATGCGVARDLALRGVAVTLVEYGDLGSGTSGRFHGMLQSGARYAVSDTGYAAECMRERRIVAAIAPEAVEPTGGLFVSLPEDPPEFPDAFRKGCEGAGIPVEELDPARVMAEEPAISRHVRRAFSVPDATVHSWRLVNLMAEDVRRHGGTVLTRHRVTGFELADGRVRAVRVDGRDGAFGIGADVVVNAAGAWSARVVDMVGGRIDLELTKGSIIALSHRIVGRAVNRCRPPTSHDIIVPTGTVSLFGTTSQVVENPDTTRVLPAEVQELLDGAEPLIPDIRRYRALRAWAGVRPLVRPESWASDEPLSRRHVVIDHADFGLDGFFTVCGGSLTTHRSMAEDVGDRVCRKLGIDRPCRTATTPLSPDTAAEYWRPEGGFERIERDRAFSAPVCECEAVDRDAIKALIDQDCRHLHDLRRRLRIGFGPCQGTFCASRVAGLLAEADRDFPVTAELGRFWTERLKGVMRTAWGEQARQALLSDAVFREGLGIRLTPDLLQDEDRR